MNTILIVDNDEDVLLALEWLLEQEGYHTTIDWGEHAALQLSDQRSFDLLLIDEELGKKNSAALLDELRQRQPGAALVLMHARKDTMDLSNSADMVCKWKRDEVRNRVRDYLAS